MHIFYRTSAASSGRATSTARPPITTCSPAGSSSASSRPSSGSISIFIIIDYMYYYHYYHCCYSYYCYTVVMTIIIGPWRRHQHRALELRGRGHVEHQRLCGQLALPPPALHLLRLGICDERSMTNNAVTHTCTGHSLL